MFDETEARELDHEPGHGAREGAADGGEESDDVDKVSEWVGVGVCVLREGEGEGRQAGRPAGRQAGRRGHTRSHRTPDTAGCLHPL